LGYVNLFILGWSAKFRTTHANSAFLAEFTVFTCPIDSIDQYGLRIISMSFFILFNRVPQPGAFVVGIPRQHIQKGISTYDAARSFGTKLDTVVCLATHNRTYMRLTATDNTVLDA